jgi:hypothetical protein
MQKGELTLKGMLDFARSALSDVFRDTASQLMKNSWKDLLKGVLPETDADKALGEMKTQSDYLKQIALNTSKTSTTGGVLSTVDPTEAGDGGLFVNKLVQSSEKQDATAGKNTKTADTFGNVVGDFGKGIKDWVSGNGSILSVFGSTISRFGSLALSLVTSLFSATSGGSGGGGILGSLLGGFGGLFGEGGFSGAFNSLIGADVGVGEYIGGALRLAAKGGVFNSPSLSAHSGTIVSSPTMFAFAKGAGLMGEAGPEAILPLKRDGQGNLGIRGGGTGEVNISIVINAETGESKTQGNSSSQNMNQLASNISGMVKEELIKQKRPGGLLYA